LTGRLVQLSRALHAQVVHPDRHGRVPGQVRNPVRQRMHVGSFDHRALQPPMAVSGGDLLLLRRRSPDDLARAPADPGALTRNQPDRSMKLLRYLLVGMAFGFVLTKAEVISWFRIQEMFRFQSFHMYGRMFSAVLIGMRLLL